MKQTGWKDIVQLTGIIAIAGSLLFLGYELRHSREAALTAYIDGTNERQNAIRMLIVEHADLWGRACAGEPLDVEERIIAAKIFDAWKDHIAAQYIYAGHGVVQSEEIKAQLIEQFTSQIWSFPGMMEFQRSNGRFRADLFDTTPDLDFFTGLGEGIQARLKELEAKDVDWEAREMDLAWCGTT